MTALEEKLIPAILEGFFDLRPVGGHIGNICLGMAGDPVEIAEFAIGDTYVGGVHISVYLPGHPSVRHLNFTEFVPDEHQVCQRRLVIEINTFFHGQKPEIEGFSVQSVEFRIH